MLNMKKQCEKCSTPTAKQAEAFICSYECTFCKECTEEMSWVCPNCQGELKSRPKRDKNLAEVATSQIKKRLFGQ